MKWFLKRQTKTDGLGDLPQRLDDAIPHLSQQAKQTIAQDIGFHRVKLHPVLRFSTAGALATLTILVLVAQSAAPGSALYALKRGSEEVLVKIQPSFHQEVEKRRHGELDELRKDKAAKERIKEAEKALKEAQKEAKDRQKDLRKQLEDHEDNSGHGGGDEKESDDDSGKGKGRDGGGDNSGSGNSGHGGGDEDSDDDD